MADCMPQFLETPFAFPRSLSAQRYSLSIVTSKNIRGSVKTGCLSSVVVCSGIRYAAQNGFENMFQPPDDGTRQIFHPPLRIWSGACHEEKTVEKCKLPGTSAVCPLGRGWRFGRDVASIANVSRSQTRFRVNERCEILRLGKFLSTDSGLLIMAGDGIIREAELVTRLMNPDKLIRGQKHG